MRRSRRGSSVLMIPQKRDGLLRPRHFIAQLNSAGIGEWRPAGDVTRAPAASVECPKYHTRCPDRRTVSISASSGAIGSA